MGGIFNYPDSGAGNYLVAAFGAASVIADMNGDGVNDVVKQTGLNPPQHVAVIYNNNPPTIPPLPNYQFNQYRIVTAQSPYFVSTGDLNNDGRLDLVITDDNADHYHLNQGNAGDGTANFSSAVFAFQSGGDDGFGSQSAVVDLNNDGFRDVVISDVDVDGFGCSRRMHIYRNLGDVPNVTLREDSPSIIPTGMLTGTHNVAPIDLNGDGWNDLVIGRCSSTEVWMNLGIKITATPPTYVNPSTGTALTAQITKSPAASIVAGSARLYVSVNGAAFAPITLTPLGGDQYSATLPAGPCGDTLRYYVSVQATLGGAIGTYTLPQGAPTAVYSSIRATGQTTVLDEAFEGSVATWSVVNDPGYVSGAWEAVDPIGTINSGAQAAPEDDNTPSPGVKAFVTQNGVVGGAAGNSDIDGGPTHLTSPTLDATTGQNLISYAYWFYTSQTSPGDTLTVAVSNNNGSTWTTARTYSNTSGGWVRDSFRISDFVAQTNQVRVRFSAVDAGTGTIAEAGVDDFRIERILCAPPCPADINGSSSVDVNDLLTVITTWGTCPGCPPTHCAGDIAPAPAGDCQIDVNDLLLVITTWGACPG